MAAVVVSFSSARGTLSTSFLAEEGGRLFPVPVTGVLCMWWCKEENYES